MQAARRSPNDRREWRYYFCPGTRKDATALLCSAASITESRIVPPVWEKLKELLTDPEVVLDSIRQYRDQAIRPSEILVQIKSIEEQKQRLLERGRRLIELYLAGSVEKGFFHSENLKLKVETDKLDDSMAGIKSLMASDEEIASGARTLQELYERYKAKLADASKEAQRELFLLFLKSVSVRGDELQIQVILPHAEQFAGRSANPSSRKNDFPIILRARLVSRGEILRQSAAHTT